MPVIGTQDGRDGNHLLSSFVELAVLDYHSHRIGPAATNRTPFVQTRGGKTCSSSTMKDAVCTAEHS